MRKSFTLSYMLLGLFLVFWVNLPRTVSEKLRSGAVMFFTPLQRGYESKREVEFNRLQLENQELRAKLETACEWLTWERALREKMSPEQPADKRQPFIQQLLQTYSAAIPARIIYRDPSSWSSSLWIKAGEKENQTLGECLIAKNSPVVSGTNLIGVIDYVGKYQSRVRLITDSGVVPAVRAMRQDKMLAKGELHGSSAPFWRSRSLFLKGIGFNYEHADQHGSSADLRSLSLQEGDLLVTSGLDGVFPEGLTVGYVTHVQPLEEGAYSYELTARPAIGHINEIKTVFVLPPIINE